MAAGLHYFYFVSIDRIVINSDQIRIRIEGVSEFGLSWTHQNNLPLSRIFREKYLQSNNNKKIPLQNVHLTVCSQLFTNLFLKNATFLHIVAVLNTLPNVKHPDETLCEEALLILFIFTCNFKRSLCKTYLMII